MHELNALRAAGSYLQVVITRYLNGDSETPLLTLREAIAADVVVSSALP